MRAPALGRTPKDKPDEETQMAKKSKRPNKAKSLVAQPLFRSRQEQPLKGKGSYRREASRNWEASSLLAA
jgi:alternative ribosome-rescue factor